MAKTLVIFDLEYTTWDGAWQRGWMGDGEYREVVQIGALKVTLPSFEILDSLNLLTKPKLNPLLSDYFQKLTQITQADLDARGLDFAEALAQFVRFCGDAHVTSYGNDNHVVVETAILQRVETGELDMLDFGTIHTFLHGLDPSLQNVNSGRLWQFFGLEKPHRADEHDALFDCYSILAALKHLHAQGQTPPFLSHQV